MDEIRDPAEVWKFEREESEDWMIGVCNRVWRGRDR